MGFRVCAVSSRIFPRLSPTLIPDTFPPIRRGAPDGAGNLDRVVDVPEPHGQVAGAMQHDVAEPEDPAPEALLHILRFQLRKADRLGACRQDAGLVQNAPVG